MNPSANTNLHVLSEIADALRGGRPVVALESTLITHGLPHPANVETALAMEVAVREGGAVPATIAVLGGKITVGLTRAEIERLATAPAGACENVRGAICRLRSRAARTEPRRSRAR